MLGYKFRDNIKRDIDETLVLNKLYAPNRDNLNDPTEMHFDDSEFISFLNRHHIYSKRVKEDYDSLLDFSRSKCGIFSLSKKVDNELLWAYYADGHKGFCIEYDLDIIMESYNYELIYKDGRFESMPLVYQIEVTYQNSFPKFTRSIMDRCIEKNDFTKLLECTIGTKSENWVKEDEVRLVFNKYGYTELDFRAVKGVYFGCRFNNSNGEISRIMGLLKGRGIKYYKMKFEDNSYTLGYDSLIDEYSSSPNYLANNLPYNDIVCTSVPEITVPNQDLIEKALKYVSQEPCINKIKSSYISLSQKPMIAIETYTNSDFKLYPIKVFRFDLNLIDRTIKLRRFQKDLEHIST